MLSKIKAGILALNISLMHFLSIYGINYKGFLSDVTYKKGSKLVKNIK